MPMGFANAFVFPYQGGEAHRLRSIKGQVPTGAMTKFLAGLRLDRVAVLDELFAGLRVLAFSQPVERFRGHITLQIEYVREPPVPLAAKSSALREIGV